MVSQIERPRATHPAIDIGARVFERVGGGVLRYGLVLLLVGIGLLKFTEAVGAGDSALGRPQPVHELAVQRDDRAGGIQRDRRRRDRDGRPVSRPPLVASPRSHRRSGGERDLPGHLQLPVHDPDLSPDAQGFLMKDFMLFGAALWATGTSLAAARTRA